MPFPDALQEFKVETSAIGAQSGMKSAGSVSLVTKSGTNEFHGDLFEFVRNGMFNARNAFATRRDTIKRNQFGGTLGRTDRAEQAIFLRGLSGHDDPSGSIGHHCVCSHGGDAGRRLYGLRFTACNAGRQITLRAPFVNNRIDPALFSKPAVRFASKLPSTSIRAAKSSMATRA